jgi:hypothetical protein
MRHARAPRPKRRGLRAIMTVFAAMLFAVLASWIISALAIWYVAMHG